MDKEFQLILTKLPTTKGAIPPLLEYYESHDAHSLTEKIKSIPAFQLITSPMKKIEGGWIPDFSSRYFTEDFPYGLLFIKKVAIEHKVITDNIDIVLDWGMKMISNNTFNYYNNYNNL